MNNLCDFDEIRNLTIGTIESVSPSEIKVLLETDAPANVAINTGVPTHFPTINGYVLVPNEQGAIVGVINWIGIEYSSFPKRKGLKDFDLIDLPFPLRKMCITPLGVLKKVGEERFEIERGVYSYPSVGDNVILPTYRQLLAIVENPDGKVEIGKAPIAGNASIKVNPDKLFGRHLAILGNTGSGKSCSVAGLIRWSLEEAEKVKENKDQSLNSRFILLDPNGEYFDTFNDLDNHKVRKFRIKLDDLSNDFEQLRIPAWMWNSQEWINFSQAAPGAQRPLLLQALLDLKRGKKVEDGSILQVYRCINTYKLTLLVYNNNFPTEASFGPFMGFCNILNNILIDLGNYRIRIDENIIADYDSAQNYLNSLLKNHEKNMYKGSMTYRTFTFREIEILIEKLDKILSVLPQNDDIDFINPDTPLQFRLDDLLPYLEHLAKIEGGNILQFVQMLALRMRFLFSDERLKSVVQPEKEILLQEWLESYIGKDEADNGILSIIDLSLVPSEIVNVVVAVLSRLIFEAIQRYRRLNKQELPTVIVLEEAHTFLKEQNLQTSNLCVETFEKIAREGRKFGLSMVLSSQRPSELSPTVLSQCNTFLLHRIVNDRDQDLIKRLVPDNLSGLLKELPILPSRKAILVGWAFPIPVLVEMSYLSKEQRPQSEDPHFWEVWTGKEKRPIDWKSIVSVWQGQDEIKEEKKDLVEQTINMN